MGNCHRPNANICTFVINAGVFTIRANTALKSLALPVIIFMNHLEHFQFSFKAYSIVSGAGLHIMYCSGYVHAIVYYVQLNKHIARVLPIVWIWVYNLAYTLSVYLPLHVFTGGMIEDNHYRGLTGSGWLLGVY